jgi:hypothetical protein
MGLSFALARTARANRTINDREIVGALSSLAKSYETLANSGLVYESPTANVLQQAVAGEIQQMLGQYREIEQKQFGYFSLKDSEVLRAIVVLLRTALSRTSGRPKSRAYIDFLFTQFPEKQGVVTPEETGSRIILP